MSLRGRKSNWITKKHLEAGIEIYVVMIDVRASNNRKHIGN